MDGEVTTLVRAFIKKLSNLFYAAKEIFMNPKKRTRAHIISDLSVNALERHVLMAGFAFERISSDYGYDAFISTFDGGGYFESGLIKIQIKSTDHLNFKGGLIYHRVLVGDLKTWSGELEPVFLVLYDAKAEISYCLHVQGYLKLNSIDPQVLAKKSVKITIDVKDSVDSTVVAGWRILKNGILGI